MVYPGFTSLQTKSFQNWIAVRRPSGCSSGSAVASSGVGGKTYTMHLRSRKQRVSGATGWMYLVGLGPFCSGSFGSDASCAESKCLHYSLHCSITVLSWLWRFVWTLREIQPHPGRHMATPNPPPKNNILQDVSEWGSAMPMSFLRPAVQLGRFQWSLLRWLHGCDGARFTCVQYTGIIRVHGDGFCYLGGGFQLLKYIFAPIWGRFPIWLILFRWVETTT